MQAANKPAETRQDDRVEVQPCAVMLFSNYELLHKACPQCERASSVFVDRMMLPILVATKFRDKSPAKCTACEWEGIAHQLRPKV